MSMNASHGMTTLHDPPEAESKTPRDKLAALTRAIEAERNSAALLIAALEGLQRRTDDPSRALCGALDQLRRHAAMLENIQHRAEALQTHPALTQ